MPIQNGGQFGVAEMVESPPTSAHTWYVSLLGHAHMPHPPMK